MHITRVPIFLLALAIAVVTFGAVLAVTMTLAQQSSSAPGGPPQISPGERDRYFHPGDPGLRTDKGSMSLEDVEAFKGYQLFWLGDSFAGYNLQAAVRSAWSPPPGVPGTPYDAVYFIYGTCTPPDGTGPCPVPIGVLVQPSCNLRPEAVAEFARLGPVETVGDGAQMQRFRDGHVQIWTGRVTVSIDTTSVETTPDFPLLSRAVAELRTAGTAGGASVAAGDPLPPPDFSGC